MTDKEIIKAIDILCKFDFFGGQRAAIDRCVRINEKFNKRDWRK